MTYKDIIIKDIEDTSSKLSDLMRENKIINDIDILLSDNTLKYDYYDIISLDLEIIQYSLLSLRLLILNDIDL